LITYFPHATTIDNETDVCSGWNDVALSEKGIRQAEALNIELKSRQFDRVYCSDLSRAQQSAAIVFPNVSVYSDTRLREMNYGELNGAPKSAFSDGYSLYKRGFSEGESLSDVEYRLRRFLSDVNWQQSNIAIVSHRFPQLALEVIINGLTWQEALFQDWRENDKWQAGWVYA
jgi:broad specificity phosphatase PhoE